MTKEQISEYLHRLQQYQQQLQGMADFACMTAIDGRGGLVLTAHIKVHTGKKTAILVHISEYDTKACANEKMKQLSEFIKNRKL